MQTGKQDRAIAELAAALGQRLTALIAALPAASREIAPFFS